MKLLFRVGTILALLVAALLASSLGWYIYSQATRPTLERNGGTIVIYELDEEQLPGSYQAEDMAAAIKRRIDPSGRAGIVVEPVATNRFEVAIPRAGDHAALVANVKELLAQVGLLEFLILANEVDDQEAFDAARKYFVEAREKPERQRALEDYAERGLPPPSPKPAQDDGFKTKLGEFTYRWMELGRSERQALYLDSAEQFARQREASKAAEKQANEQPSVLRDLETTEDRQNASRWKRAAQARAKREPLVLPDFGRTFLFSRECKDQKLSKEERMNKKVDYFLLTRDPEKDPSAGESKSISGRDLASVKIIRNGVLPAISFHLSKQGGDRFYELTSKNAPSDSLSEPFARYLAVVLDGRIVTAAPLHAIIRADAVIEGNFTPAQADRLGAILRAGALSARLRSLPVAEVVVEPKSVDDK
jgi:preprotein translocase subunit SecD